MAIKKSREALTIERNEKISEMNLYDLKKYLCMKNGQNPEKCIGCPGIATCTAGQRAVVLLDSLKKEQEKKPSTLSDKKKHIREMMVIACQQPDMIQWLMEKDGVNRDAAWARLKYWGTTNAELASELGFMEKFKNCKKPERKENSFNDIQVEQAKASYVEAMSHDDPVAFLMDKYGILKSSAQNRLDRYKKRYGEIEPQKPAEEESGEINIEDFLNETETTEPVQAEQVQEEQKDDYHNDDLYQALQKKWDKLEAERVSLNKRKEELNKELQKLNDRVYWITKAEDSLMSTWSLFYHETRPKETAHEEE